MKFSMHLKRDIFKFKDHAQVYLMSHMREPECDTNHNFEL